MALKRINQGPDTGLLEVVDQAAGTGVGTGNDQVTGNDQAAGLGTGTGTGTGTAAGNDQATGTAQPTVTPQVSAYDPPKVRPHPGRPGPQDLIAMSGAGRPRTAIDEDLDRADDPLARVPDVVEGDPDSRFARDLEESITSGKPLRMSMAEAVAMFEPQPKPAVPSIFDTFAVKPVQPKDMGAMDGSHENELDEACSVITLFADELSAEQANKVYLALRQHHTLSLGNYGADFDVSQEIGEQLAIAKAMRARLLDEEGRLNERFSAREAKEVMSACSTLIGVLMKSQQELLSFRRVLMVENATKRALDTLPREAQDAYLHELERQLATT